MNELEQLQTSTRNKKLFLDYKSGMTRKELAAKYKITSTRVGQLIIYVERLIRLASKNNLE